MVKAFLYDCVRLSSSRLRASPCSVVGSYRACFKAFRMSRVGSPAGRAPGYTAPTLLRNGTRPIPVFSA